MEKISSLCMPRIGGHVLHLYTYTPIYLSIYRGYLLVAIIFIFSSPPRALLVYSLPHISHAWGHTYVPSIWAETTACPSQRGQVLPVLESCSCPTLVTKPMRCAATEYTSDAVCLKQNAAPPYYFDQLFPAIPKFSYQRKVYTKILKNNFINIIIYLI